MSYSTCVYLHGYCSSFIIILLISSLSDSHHSSLFLSSQLSLIYKVDQLLLLLRRRSRAPRTEFDRRVWAASELGTPISLSDPTIRLETETMMENWSDMEGEWVRVVVIVIVSLLWLLLWKISESLLLWLLLCCCCCDCCCGRSVNQWLDFVEGWLAGVVWKEKTRWWVCAREEREENNKKCKKNEYFIK